MENETGLTEEELKMLSQCNVDNFVKRQKRFNENIQEALLSQTKFNKETMKLEREFTSELEKINRRIDSMMRSLVYFGIIGLLMLVMVLIL